MSRSRVLVGLLAATLFALGAHPARAQKGALLDAIGEVDYDRGPSVAQVGSWASYHVTVTRNGRVADEYDVTMMVAGEEEWWGEECFWLETTTQQGTKATVTAATLMSSAIFEDSLPLKNIMFYQRKRIAELDENGQPVQQTLRLGKAAVKARVPADPGLTTRVDTLATDTLKTPRGDLACLRLRTEKGVGATSQSADSSRYAETREVRVTEVSRQVPVTGKAREEITVTESQRTWLTGRSKESGPLLVVSEIRTVMELRDFGTSGREAQIVPEPFRRSLAEQRRAPMKPQAPKVFPPKR
jgi:hypothetical protein